MARKKESDQLTPLELEIMKVLWEGGPSTVQTVQQRLTPERALAYTTVQTMLNGAPPEGQGQAQTKGPGVHLSLPASAAATPCARQWATSSIGSSRGPLRVSCSAWSRRGRLTPEKLTELSRLIEQSKETPDGED